MNFIKVLKQNNMKIIGIKQIKTNIYEIIVEKSESFLLFDETILKYYLTVGKELTKNDIKQFKLFDKVIEEYYSVLKSIKSKIKTKKEILDILNKKNLTDENIDYIISKLENINLINDDKYTDKYINYKINTTNHGPKKIKDDLVKKGISIDLINKYLSITSDEIWNQKIKKIIDKKINSNRKYSNKELILKLKLYLLNLGYYEESFSSLLVFEDSNNELLLLEKEYNKQVKKYSRKNMTSSELNYKVKTNLFIKGFKKVDIDKFLEKKNED